MSSDSCAGGRVEFRRFANPAELAAAAATEFLSMVRNSAHRNSPWRVALPGGRITRQFLAAVRAGAASAAWNHVVFLWGDERVVPPEHPDSNYRLANEELLGHPVMSAARVYRIQGELPPSNAADAIDDELRSMEPGGAIPSLDLVILGMGEDAHVASLFPGAPPEVTESQRMYLAVTGPKPPPNRVSLSFAALARAREIWVLASGTGKEAALRDSLAVESSTPLGRVIRSRSRTLIFTDIKLDAAP